MTRIGRLGPLKKLVLKELLYELKLQVMKPSNIFHRFTAPQNYVVLNVILNNCQQVEEHRIYQDLFAQVHGTVHMVDTLIDS